MVVNGALVQEKIDILYHHHSDHSRVESNQNFVKRNDLWQCAICHYRPRRLLPRYIVTFSRVQPDPGQVHPTHGHNLLQAETIHTERRAILHRVENPLWITTSRGLIPRTTVRPPWAKRLLPTIPHTFDLPQPQRHCQILARRRWLRRRLVQQNGHESLHPNPTTTIHRESWMEWRKIPRHDNRH